MTYAETKGEKPFNWSEWLDNAIKNPGEFPADHEEKTYMAFSWVTCACGNQCSVIPRFTTKDELRDVGVKDVPKDERLRELGENFAWEVEDGRFEDAKATLMEIEHRSAFLIASLNLNPSAS